MKLSIVIASMLVSIAAAISPIASLADTCASADNPSAPLPPRSESKELTIDSIEPSPSEELSLVSLATGVQIYQCQAQPDKADKFAWQLAAPEADLFDRQGQKIGTHYLGPTWEANDGSKIVGKVKSRIDAKSADAIPWLLLAVTKTEGNGILSKITSIQRLDTVGGKAPVAGCTSSDVGKKVRIPYSATYKFYQSKQKL